MMSLSPKPVPGAPSPIISVPRVGGGEIVIGAADGWQVVVIYRGRHCPLCRKHLTELNDRLSEFEAMGMPPVAISADTLDKAETEAKEEGWRFPVGYGLTLDDMRRLGLYISEPRSPEETDRPFAEPGLFVIRPDHTLQIVDISNAPAARPALPLLLLGLRFTLKNDLPVRGTAV
jgi:peroxiredoxin